MKLYKTEYNHYKDATESWYYDEATNSFTIRNNWNVGDVLASNKRLANASVDSRFGSGLMHHAAEIPLGVVTKFMKDYNIDVFSSDPDHKKRLMKKLDEPEWRYLKTTVKMFSRRGAGR